MVPAGLQAEFSKRGVQLISRSDGPRHLDREICYGRNEDAEIILGGSGFEKALSKKVKVVRKNKPGFCLFPFTFSLP